ncbi:Putative Holin-X, holin superfamily III [Cognatiyoonia koreensis]|uniref:Putative Holin-X, holin superfamily III n=1 Tax=Cognatiyoonia koreensis TaxID=364200 RepID=A0A1I0PXL7_9RHOB|nr:phage holin family protein [Cognatiyoonia koreensis]SEW19366.1 Putative Holin-X, holin superfamily III [Cognatiyoonia koreensis]
MKTPGSHPDTTTAVSSILAHLHRLLRKELALLKSEMSARLNRVFVACALLAAAMVIAVAGFHVLTAAAVAALIASGFSPTAAACIIAALCLLIAGGLVWKGTTMLKSASLVPHDTISTIRKDARALKETYNG